MLSYTLGLYSRASYDISKLVREYGPFRASLGEFQLINLLSQPYTVPSRQMISPCVPPSDRPVTRWQSTASANPRSSKLDRKALCALPEWHILHLIERRPTYHESLTRCRVDVGPSLIKHCFHFSCWLWSHYTYTPVQHTCMNIY